MNKKYNKSGQEIRVMLKNEEEYLTGLEIILSIFTVALIFLSAYLISFIN
tara:strand:+ start:357 stop:506 length:150 start_codon:yes stop_codon:yes gene_type:complete